MVMLRPSPQAAAAMWSADTAGTKVLQEKAAIQFAALMEGTTRPPEPSQEVRERMPTARAFSMPSGSGPLLSQMSLALRPTATAVGIRPTSMPASEC